MAEITDLNGNSLHGKTVITLEYEHESGRLNIGGDTTNVDRALNMFSQAARWLESVYRMQQAERYRMEMEQARQLQAQIGPRLIT